MRLRSRSAEIGRVFFGGKIGALDPVSKELAADALLHEPELSGQGGAMPGRLPLRLRPTFLLCSIAALAAVFWSAVRYGSRPGTPPTGALWLAAHGEWSNRTRHLLGLVPAGDQPIPLILLGRPKDSLKAVAALLDGHLPGRRFTLVRPVSLGAAKTSLTSMLAALRHALRIAARCGYMPPPARAVPILYRLCLGAVHREWWRRSGAKPTVVIYAHTGTADTCALELEQQAQGTKTVHLIHGISKGHEFSGLSDLAITRCRHDAEWHEALGGYGAVTFVEARKPALARPSAEWALLTNYAHPTSFADEEAAVRYEIRAIEVVASAAERLGRGAGGMLYRPHPGVAALTEDSRRRVANAAAAAGLTTWPADRSVHPFPAFEILVTTPSTIVQDALCAGTVAVLLDLVGVEADSVYGTYPFRASSEDQLVEVIRRVAESREQAFEQAWQAVGPGMIPSLQQIAALAAASGKQRG